MRRSLLAVTFALAPFAAPAQDLPGLDAVAGQAGDLAQRLAEGAAEHVMVADMLGREVVGTDGEALGTVEDFVAIPGGNLVAAVIARPEGRRIALPWDAVKAGVAAGQPAEVPFTGAEIDGQEALRQLSDALGL